MNDKNKVLKHTSLPWLLKSEAILARKAACMDPKLGILHPLPEDFWSICKKDTMRLAKEGGCNISQ